MKRVIFVCSLLLVGLVFSSCNKSDVETLEKRKLKFTYQGKTYETLYQIVGDEKIYDDEEAANIYSGLLKMNLFPLINTDNSIDFFENYDDFFAQKVKPSQSEPSISRKSYSDPAESKMTIRLYLNTYMTGNYDTNFLYVYESNCKTSGISQGYWRNNAYWEYCTASVTGARSFNANVVKIAGSTWEDYANGYVVLTNGSNLALCSFTVNLNGGAAGSVDLTALNLSAPVRMAEFLATYY
jgi:hypothetical protein